MEGTLQSKKMEFQKMYETAQNNAPTMTDNEMEATQIKLQNKQMELQNFEANFYIWPYDAEYLYRERLFLRETVEYDGWCRMIPKCVAAMLDEPVFGKLEKITIPTLIIFGENDGLIPNTFLHKTLNTQQVAQLAQSKIPGSRLRLLPQAGHFVHWEQMALTNQAIREFLEE